MVYNLPFQVEESTGSSDSVGRSHSSSPSGIHMSSAVRAVRVSAVLLYCMMVVGMILEEEE